MNISLPTNGDSAATSSPCDALRCTQGHGTVLCPTVTHAVRTPCARRLYRQKRVYWRWSGRRGGGGGRFVIQHPKAMWSARGVPGCARYSDAVKEVCTPWALPWHVADPDRQLWAPGMWLGHGGGVGAEDVRGRSASGLTAVCRVRGYAGGGGMRVPGGGRGRVGVRRRRRRRRRRGTEGRLGEGCLAGQAPQPLPTTTSP